MKKIYTITLDNEDYPSECLWDDVRIIASMVYDYIYNYIGDNYIPLDVNSDIIYNNIFYSRCSKFACYERSHYQLDSDIYDDGYINYEPFIVGRNTFGMTIVDDSFDITIIESIVKYVLDLLKLNYKFTIESFPYQSKNISDESYRDGAINIIYDKFSSECIKRTRIRRLLKNTFSKKSNKISVCGR